MHVTDRRLCKTAMIAWYQRMVAVRTRAGQRICVIMTVIDRARFRSKAVTFQDRGLGGVLDSVRPYVAQPKLAPWWESDQASYIYGLYYVICDILIFAT
jgi:hypothetical protein